MSSHDSDFIFICNGRPVSFVGVWLEGMIVEEDCMPLGGEPLELELRAEPFVLPEVILQSCNPFEGDRKPRRSGQKSRPHWPLDKRGGRR
jgi:hypothetical protein